MSNLNKCSMLINIYFVVEAFDLLTTYLLFHCWWVLQRIILEEEKVNQNMFTSHLCRLKRPYHSHFYFRKYQPGLSSCKGAVRKAKEVKCFQEKYIEKRQKFKGVKNPFSHFFRYQNLRQSFMKSNSSNSSDDFRLSYLNYISKPYPELFVF